MERQVYEFIAAQTGENIVERKECPNCGQEFAITDKDLEFYSKISPIFNGTRYEIPAPTLCPDCRQQRRLARRNERKLYKRKCDLTWKTMLTCYHPDTKYKIYEQKEWRTDKWNAMDYGRDFDFTRTFFEQFAELVSAVPRMSMLLVTTENSDYNNYASYLKNCYLNFDSTGNEDTLYVYNVWNAKKVLDSNVSNTVENCYQCIDCANSYNLFFSQNCENCVNSYFLKDCKWCADCIWCINLNNNKNCILNKQYTKEEYEQNKNKYIQNFTKNDEEFLSLQKKNYFKNISNKSTSESYGNNLLNSKGCVLCFDSFECVDSKYVTNCTKVSDSYDYESAAWPSSLCLELNWTMTCNNTAFGVITWCDNSYYCDHCMDGKNLFGCVWVHNNSKYCILNKQYTKEEYEELVPKIIEHMKSTWERWEFFPASISPFGYNETVANEYFPLSREQAIAKWFKWQDKEYPINVPEWIELIKWQDLPKDIKDVKDDILDKAIICEVSGKPFRIVKPELEFYRKYKFPLPRKHPDIRHLERLNKRAPRNLYLRNCDNCSKQVISVYPQNNEFKVYCEECYNKKNI